MFRKRLSTLTKRLIATYDYLSANHLGRMLGIHHTTVLYYRNRLKRKPKQLYNKLMDKITAKQDLVLMNNIILTGKIDMDNPKAFAKDLRKQFKTIHGVNPEKI